MIYAAVRGKVPNPEKCTVMEIMVSVTFPSNPIIILAVL